MNYRRAEVCLLLSHTMLMLSNKCVQAAKYCNHIASVWSAKAREWIGDEYP